MTSDVGTVAAHIRSILFTYGIARPCSIIYCTDPAVAAQNVSTGTCHLSTSCTGGTGPQNTFDDCCVNSLTRSFTSNGDGDLNSGCYDCQDSK